MSAQPTPESELWAELVRFQAARRSGKLEVNIHDGRITGWWLAPLRKPGDLAREADFTGPSRNGTLA